MYWQIENIVFGKLCFFFSAAAAAAVALTAGRRAITDPIRSVGNFPMHFQNHFSNQFWNNFSKLLLFSNQTHKFPNMARISYPTIHLKSFVWSNSDAQLQCTGLDWSIDGYGKRVRKNLFSSWPPNWNWTREVQNLETSSGNGKFWWEWVRLGGTRSIFKGNLDHPLSLTFTRGDQDLVWARWASIRYWDSSPQQS